MPKSHFDTAKKRLVARLLNSDTAIFVSAGAVLFVYVATVAVFALIDNPTTIPYISQSITTMQDMTTSVCDKMPMHSTMALTDTRNSQDYRVRKMPDGKCWMIDNLKLATPGNDLELNHNSSDIDDDQYTFVIPANPVQNTSTHSNGRCDSGGIMANGSGYLTCDGTSTQSSSNTGFAAYSNPNDTTLNTTVSCASGQLVDPNSTTDCGYLYNWYTATAGTGTYNTGPNIVATSSICPVGWRLPKSDGTDGLGNEFAMLNAKMYDINAVSGVGRTFDTKYVKNWWHTGLFAGSLSSTYVNAFYAQGHDGSFWSSSERSSSDAWSLSFWYDRVNPGSNSYYKYGGFAVRCVAS